MLFLKRTLPLIITFCTGLIMITAFFTGPALPTIKAVRETFPRWIQIIMSFTMVLGAVSLLRLNLQKITRKVEGYGYSIVLVSGFVCMAFLGFATGGWPMFESEVNTGEQYYHFSEDNMLSKYVTIIEVTTNDEGDKIIMASDPEGEVQRVSYSRLRSRPMAWLVSTQMVLFEGVFRAAQATMFSLLAFFVASASFRAFRVKSKEAGLLMGAAFIVMLGNVPLGGMFTRLITSIPVIGQYVGPHVNIPMWKEWILTYPSSAAQSAILIGAMLGIISASMKIIIGVERSHLGGEG